MLSAWNLVSAWWFQWKPVLFGQLPQWPRESPAGVSVEIIRYSPVCKRYINFDLICPQRLIWVSRAPPPLWSWTVNNIVRYWNEMGWNDALLESWPRWLEWPVGRIQGVLWSCYPNGMMSSRPLNAALLHSDCTNSNSMQGLIIKILELISTPEKHNKQKQNNDWSDKKINRVKSTEIGKWEVLNLPTERQIYIQGANQTFDSSHWPSAIETARELCWHDCRVKRCSVNTLRFAHQNIINAMTKWRRIEVH